MFLECRLLAELCRKQQMLALFGWSLQGPSVNGEIEVGEPLASQILGSEIFGVATLMLQDVQGWMQMFRAKVVEPG
jgi:hypothetical protein